MQNPDRLAEIAESQVVYLPYYLLFAFECHRTDGAPVQERLADFKIILDGSYD